MNCIYCQRPKEQHKNDGQIELLGDSGRCCPGFTSQADLSAPNFITYGIGSECLKDMLFSMERAIEVLTDIGLDTEAAEIQAMKPRLETVQQKLYSTSMELMRSA